MCLWPEKFTSLELVQDLANTVRSGEGNASGVGNSWEDPVLGGGQVVCIHCLRCCPTPAEVGQTKSPCNWHLDGGCGALPVAPGLPLGLGSSHSAGAPN